MRGPPSSNDRGSEVVDTNVEDGHEEGEGDKDAYRSAIGTRVCCKGEETEEKMFDVRGREGGVRGRRGHESRIESKEDKVEREEVQELVMREEILDLVPARFNGRDHGGGGSNGSGWGGGIRERD